MPRYQINIDTSGTLSHQFMIDDSYVGVDYEDNTTTISKLLGCILVDTISVSQAVQFDMTDLASVSEKVKTILLFS